MKTKLTFIILFFCAVILNAQESKKINPLGLSVEYGIGSSAIKDEYVSQERYTGSMNYIGFWYGRMNDQKGFQLGLTNQQGDDFKNYAIRADFSRVSLNFDQFFSIKEFKIFSKPSTWYFGPSVEYFEYELINRFSSNHKVFSEYIMVSMGINTFIDWNISEKFITTVFLRSNVVSVNHKLHDEQKYPEQEAKLQTFFVSNNINGDLFLRYKILKRISLGLKLKGQYTRSTGWDKSVSYTNSILLFVIVHF